MSSLKTYSVTTPDGSKVQIGLQKTPQLYNYSGTITFSPCGATGHLGPSLANARSAYTSQPYQGTWLANTNLFNVVAGVQFWRVPKDGTYTIVAAGAGTSAAYSGAGIILSTTYVLEAGEILRIVVGQKGVGNAGVYSGGGGATAIAVQRMNQWVPIVVAGGGAGQSSNSPNSTNTNRNARSPTDSTRGPIGGRGSYYQEGYSSGIGSYWPGGGGGGWAQDGHYGAIGLNNNAHIAGGTALGSPSPIGGVNWDAGWHGGFGGGGSTGRDGGAAGGGGGWDGGNATYVGTGASSDDTTLLGGGSYSENSWTNQGTNTGQGYATVTI